MAKKNISTDSAALAALKTTIGIADPVLSYTKDDVDTLLLAKAEVGDAYTKSEENALLTANEKTSYLLKALQYFGSTVKALPIGVGINGITNGTSALTSRAIQRVGFLIEKETIVTGVNFILQTAFVGTGDQYNGFGLYSLNISTGLSTKITETANDLDLFKATAYTMGVKAFPTPQTLAAGVYYIDLLYCSSAQSTAPTIYTWGTISANQTLYLPSPHKFTGILTGQTALAATVNNSAFTASTVYAAVSLY